MWKVCRSDFAQEIYVCFGHRIRMPIRLEESAFDCIGMCIHIYIYIYIHLYLEIA